jgi:hypothetical protein
MSEKQLQLPIGQRVALPGHCDVPVKLEEARPLGADGSSGYECRVRLPDGSLDETVISALEAASLAEKVTADLPTVGPANPERLRLLVESTRIRLA